MGSANITGFDVDEDALETCWVNLRKMEIGNVDLIQSDIQSIQLANSFDTVVMNPPFGTRNSGIDSAFVLKGMEYSNVVYSLHKTSTREVVTRCFLIFSALIYSIKISIFFASQNHEITKLR